MIIFGDINTHLEINKTTRQKINNNAENNSTVNQHKVIDVNIYQPVGIVFFPLTTLFPSFSSYLP